MFLAERIMRAVCRPKRVVFMILVLTPCVLSVTLLFLLLTHDEPPQTIQVYGSPWRQLRLTGRRRSQSNKALSRREKDEGIKEALNPIGSMQVRDRKRRLSHKQLLKKIQSQNRERKRAAEKERRSSDKSRGERFSEFVIAARPENPRKGVVKRYRHIIHKRQTMPDREIVKRSWVAFKRDRRHVNVDEVKPTDEQQSKINLPKIQHETSHFKPKDETGLLQSQVKMVESEARNEQGQAEIRTREILDNKDHLRPKKEVSSLEQKGETSQLVRDNKIRHLQAQQRSKMNQFVPRNETSHLETTNEIRHSEPNRKKSDLERQKEISHFKPQNDKSLLETRNETRHLETQRDRGDLMQHTHISHSQLQNENSHLETRNKIRHSKPKQEQSDLEHLTENEISHLEPQNEKTHLKTHNAIRHSEPKQEKSNLTEISHFKPQNEKGDLKTYNAIRHSEPKKKKSHLERQKEISQYKPQKEKSHLETQNETRHAEPQQDKGDLVQQTRISHSDLQNEKRHLEMGNEVGLRHFEPQRNKSDLELLTEISQFKPQNEKGHSETPNEISHFEPKKEKSDLEQLTGISHSEPQNEKIHLGTRDRTRQVEPQRDKGDLIQQTRISHSELLNTKSHLETQNETLRYEPKQEKSDLEQKTEISHFEPQKEKSHLGTRNETRHFEPKQEKSDIEQKTEISRSEPQNEKSHFETRNEIRHSEPKKGMSNLEQQSKMRHYVPLSKKSHLQPQNKTNSLEQQTEVTSVKPLNEVSRFEPQNEVSALERRAEMSPLELQNEVHSLQPQDKTKRTEPQSEIKQLEALNGKSDYESQHEESGLEQKTNLEQLNNAINLLLARNPMLRFLQPDRHEINANISLRERREASDADLALASSLPLVLRNAVVRVLFLNRGWSQSRPQGGEVELSCRNNAMQLFKQEVPVLKIQWLLNGDPLKVQPSRMLFDGDDLLIIQDLRISDTGVYECRAAYAKNRAAVTVGIFALTVTTANDTPTLAPREMEPLTLKCHSEQLAAVMRTVDLTIGTDPDFGCKGALCETNANISRRTWRQWFHNGTKTSLFSDSESDQYHMIPGDRSRPESVERSTRNMSGVWHCLVFHKTSGKKWNTSWYRVFVKDQPSSLELSWRYLLHRPWLVSIVGTMLLGACISLSILVARKAQKEDENLEKRWQVTKNRMVRHSTRLVASISITSQNSLKQGSGERASEDESADLIVLGPGTDTASGTDSETGSHVSSKSFRNHHSKRTHETQSLINKHGENDVTHSSSAH